MKPEGNIKQEHILEAAIRRFSHFGINKTTLTEIADDLAISKPSVFYYFADKNALIAAVARKIFGEFLENLEARTTSASSAEQGLLMLVEVKREYFEKYFLLGIQSQGEDIAKVPAELSSVYEDAKRKTVALLAAVIKQGIHSGELRPLNAERISTILLDTLSSFEYCTRHKRRLPDHHDFDELFDRQRELITIIVNGLK